MYIFTNINPKHKPIYRPKKSAHAYAMCVHLKINSVSTFYKLFSDISQSFSYNLQHVPSCQWVEKNQTSCQVIQETWVVSLLDVVVNSERSRKLLKLLLSETNQSSGCWTKNRGGPPKWMVKIMENPMNKWMIWGYYYFWKHPSMNRFLPPKLRVLSPELSRVPYSSWPSLGQHWSCHPSAKLPPSCRKRR